MPLRLASVAPCEQLSEEPGFDVHIARSVGADTNCS
jgi:hypothetical protein